MSYIYINTQTWTAGPTPSVYSSSAMCAYSYYRSYVLLFSGSSIAYYNDADGGAGGGSWTTDASLTLSSSRTLGFAVTFYDAAWPNFENVYIIAGYSPAQSVIDVMDTVAWDITFYTALNTARFDLHAIVDDVGRIWVFGGNTDTIEVSESIYDSLGGLGNFTGVFAFVLYVQVH